MKHSLWVKRITIWEGMFLVCLPLFAQWEPDVRLTYTDSVSTLPQSRNSWSVAATGDTVHVVWNEINQGYQVYYKRSTNGGETWGLDIPLTTIPSSSWPEVAVCGSVVHVVWSRYGYEIYYRRSTDGGITWEPEVRLDDDTSYSQLPSIAASGSYVHVVWIDMRNGALDIYYKRSTDEGANWGPDIQLISYPVAAFGASIAAADSLVHVVWKDARGPIYNRDIYYIRSTDAGTTWEPDTFLTNYPTPYQGLEPCVAATGTSVHVVWEHRSNFFEIDHKRSRDGGKTWEPDQHLVLNDSFTYYPSVAASNSNVHIVWMYSTGGLSDFEVYYIRSIDGGTQWEPETCLTMGTPGGSLHPCVAVSDSIVHVVWHDERDGNYEIYYKRNPTGNVSIEEATLRTVPDALRLEVHPNPFSKLTYISFEKVKSEKAKGSNYELKIYDATGRLIKLTN